MTLWTSTHSQHNDLLETGGAGIFLTGEQCQPHHTPKAYCYLNFNGKLELEEDQVVSGTTLFDS